MKLTIVMLGMVGLLMGAESFAAPKKAAAKPAARPAARTTASRAAPRPAARNTTAARTATRPVAKTAARPAARAIPTRTTSGATYGASTTTRTAGMPARGTANRAPAQAAPAKPASGKPSTQSAQDTTGLANSIRSMQTTPMASEMGGRMMRGPSSSHEIGEAMRVTGQSRNLSMGLLFSKDNDKIEFGNPRMHYKDKITSKQANY